MPFLPHGLILVSGLFLFIAGWIWLTDWAIKEYIKECQREESNQ